MDNTTTEFTEGDLPVILRDERDSSKSQLFWQ